MEKAKGIAPRQFTFLYHLGMLYNSLLHLKHFLVKILYLLEDIAQYTNAAFLLKEGEGFMVAAAKGCREKERGKIYPPQALSWIEDKTQPYHIPDVKSHPQAQAFAFFKEGSILLAPLSTQTEEMGFLLLEKENPFTTEDISFLQAIAPYLSPAIEVAQEYEQALSIMHKDSLTGFPNQAYFYLRLREELSLAKRKGRPFSIVIIDVDGLKEINDKYGHLAGDETLKVMGQKIKANLRGCDGMVRYGGDEFALILPDTPKEKAETVLQRLINLVRKAHFSYQGRTIPLPHFSYGIATYPQDGEEPKQLFNSADRCLYLSRGTKLVDPSHVAGGEGQGASSETSGL